MTYPFEVDGNITGSERIALDCMAGEGFSGSPVFSSRNGDIVGMIDSLPNEICIEDIKITNPSPLEGDVRVRYAAGLSFAIPSKLIRRFVEYAQKFDWENQEE